MGCKMEPVEFKDGNVILLDQTLLPLKIKYIECDNIDCIAEAIKNLRVRGAPALGVTAAFTLAMIAYKYSDKKEDEIIRRLIETQKFISKTRPTAFNLFWAMNRIIERCKISNNPGEIAIEEAIKIYKENKEGEIKIGKFGSDLIEKEDVILTHCNAGSLATAGIGTALGIIKTAWKDGKKISVFVDETRPLLQGARLTAFEMVEEGIPVTVISDSAAAFTMSRQGINKVIVGADRIAANGDTANKIGTYGLAILAKEHDIPFYIAAPTSTIDHNLASWKSIPIEYRDWKEIAFIGNTRYVPKGVNTLNPAFDVTPNKYISGIITEKGVLKPSFKKSILSVRSSTFPS